MANLNVGVFGAAGKMGAIACQAINNNESMTLRLGVDTNQIGTGIPKHLTSNRGNCAESRRH